MIDVDKRDQNVINSTSIPPKDIKLLDNVVLSVIQHTYKKLMSFDSLSINFKSFNEILLSCISL